MGIKACFLVGTPVPMCHCMLRLCHRWLPLLFGPVLQTAMWATGFAPGAINDPGSPVLATGTTMPYFFGITTKCVLCGLVWVLIAPLCCHNRSIDSKGVVGTDSFSITERTAVALCISGPTCSAADHGLPIVQVTGWTLITLPPNLSVAAGCDDNGVEVKVFGVVPLALQ